MTLYYPVILKKLAHTYRAEFCDLDGCYGEGKDMEDALDDARNEGISYIPVSYTHLDVYKRQPVPLPYVSPRFSAVSSATDTLLPQG